MSSLSVNTKLINKEAICSMLKRELYSAASYYQNLDYHLKNELFGQSMRPLAYEILTTARLQNNRIPYVTKLINEIKELRKKLSFRQESAGKDIDEIINKKVQENSTMLETVDYYSGEEVKTKALVGRYVNGLKMLTTKLRSENTIQAYLDIALKSEVILMKITNNLGMDLDDSSTFTEIRQLIQMTNSNAMSSNQMESAKLEYETVNQHLTNYHNMSYFIHFSKHEEALYKALDQSLTQLKTAYEQAKSKTQALLEQIHNRYSQAVKQNNTYMQYINTIKEARSKKDYQHSCSRNSEDAQVSSKNTQQLIKIFSSKQPRVIPEDIIWADGQIGKIKDAIKLVNDQNEIKYIHQSSISQQIKIFKSTFKDLHLTDLQNKLRLTEELRNNFKLVLEKEKLLDQVFGEIVAELQNNHDSAKFEICMSDQELSVFLYYMTLTGVISSKQEFLRAYFKHLNPDAQVKSARQIYMVFLQRQGVDSFILDPDTESLSNDDVEKLVKIFNDMMKIELNKVFETQLDYLRNPSFLTIVMGHMGIDSYNILEGFLEVGYEHFFGQLTVALLAVFGLTVQMGIAVSALTVFLVWLCNKLVTELIRIAKDEDELATYKNSFYQHMSKVYKFFFVEDAYSLNYAEYMANEVYDNSINLKEIARFPNGTINQNIFNILDSIYTGPDFFVSASIMKKRVLVVI
jgi:hypothetical protein